MVPYFFTCCSNTVSVGCDDDMTGNDYVAEFNARLYKKKSPFYF